MSESKFVQNNSRPNFAQQNLDSKERKKLKTLDLEKIKLPPYFASISLKSIFIRSAVNRNILPASIISTSPVKTLLIFDREVSKGVGPGTVQPEHMREISFLNYDTKMKFSRVLEKYGSESIVIDDARLATLAHDILDWIPDEVGVYLGYCQCKNADMSHLLNVINKFASQDNKARMHPITRECFIDYQREIIMNIFSDKPADSLYDPSTAVFAPNHKLGSLSKWFWKGTNEESIPMDLKVKSEKGDGKSVLDNCHVFHLIERAGSCF
jgi:hypothetical protein